MANDHTLIIKYRDSAEDTEIVSDKHSVLHVASRLNDTHIEYAEVQDPNGVVIWDNIEGHIAQ